MQLSDEITGLRRLMADLRPPVLDAGGLDAAIADYLRSFSDRTGIAHTIDSCTVDLVAADELVIYRVVQEALANVYKHANASHVRVHLAGKGDSVEVVIEDDGCGFDTSRTHAFVRDNHFGLIGMRERVERMHGTWRVRSASGEGTRISVSTRSRPLQVDRWSPLAASIV